tara:strand:+ start:14473 stop:15099 length:627 start_codon:yes stop_codon:yes gene_type:complete
MIGVFGGSFDPIHFGHIKPLIELNKEFNFNNILLIPCNLSPSLKKTNASAIDRFEMTKVISQSNTNNFLSDDIEIKRGGISYSYDTLRDIKNKYGQNILLIIGADVFLNFDKWYNYNKIINMVNIIVLNRPKYNTDFNNSLPKEIIDKIITNKDDFLNEKSGYIYLFNNSEYNISSTIVRSMIKNKKEPISMTPGSVYSYIKRNKLYK